MSAVQELLDLAAQLTSAAAEGDAESIADPLKALDAATDKIGGAFCGSWLGYHSRVYYEALQPTPPGASFNQEWGLREQ